MFGCLISVLFRAAQQFVGRYIQYIADDQDLVLRRVQLLALPVTDRALGNTGPFPEFLLRHALLPYKFKNLSAYIHPSITLSSYQSRNTSPLLLI